MTYRSLVVLSALLAGCAVPTGGDGPPARDKRVPNAVRVPQPEPRSASGNPRFYDVYGQRYYVMQDARGYKEQGVASWYGKKFHGRLTSSGEVYDMHAVSAAHKTLPLPTWVRVTNLANNKSVVLRVNDRGPFVDDRLIDLSYAAARELDLINAGTGRVEVEAINFAPSDSQPTEPQAANPIYMQIGAFSDRDNALRLKNRAAPLIEQEVAVYAAETGRKTVYRVHVGPIGSVQEFDGIATTLAAIDIRQVRLVSPPPAAQRRN
ncbi:MAG: septal ring lytic transglycosylase RlpA family protein [Woeseiaceae bacterium]